MTERTMGARVAVIEEVVLRMEAKLDAHIETTHKRVSRLERAWAYAAGAISLAVLYVKAVWIK